MKIPLISVVAAFLIETAIVQAAIFPGKGAVKNLDHKNYRKTLADGNIAIIAYTAPWCGYCKQLVPELVKAAESLSPLISIYNIDCDAQENKAICAEQSIQGFPTIKAFPKGSKGPARDYSGERKAAAIASYAQSLVPDKVKKMKKASEIEAFVADKPSLPHALLLHPSQPSIPLLWKVLASRLQDKVSFGFHRDQDGSGRKVVGIDDSGDTKVDGVKVIGWGKDGEKYFYGEGPLKFEPLLAWFTQLASGKAPTSSPSSSSSSSSDSSQDSFSPPPIVDDESDQQPPPKPSNGISDAELKAQKRKAMELKWAEEEKRDKARREKREAAKKAAAAAAEAETRAEVEVEEDKTVVEEIPQREEELVAEGILPDEAESVETGDEAKGSRIGDEL